MDKHEAFIRQIAEEMTAAEGIKKETYHPEHWLVIIKRFEIYARTAIKRMAEEYERAYMQNCPAGKHSVTYNNWLRQCKEIMIKCSLIPSYEAGTYEVNVRLLADEVAETLFISKNGLGFDACIAYAKDQISYAAQAFEEGYMLQRLGEIHKAYDESINRCKEEMIKRGLIPVTQPDTSFPCNNRFQYITDPVCTVQCDTCAAFYSKDQK